MNKILTQIIDNQRLIAIIFFQKTDNILTSSDIGDRIIEVIEDEKSPAAFCRKTGWTSGDISNIRKNPSSSVGYMKLKAILDAYEAISAEWLMRGEGAKWRVVTEGGSMNVQIGNGNAAHQHVATQAELVQQTIAAQAKTIAVLEERLAELLGR